MSPGSFALRVRWKEGCPPPVTNPHAVRSPFHAFAPAFLVAFFCLVIVPLGSTLRAAGQIPGPSVLVADDASEDATASNNQVKLVREPSGRLLVAYVQMAGGPAQVMLVASSDGGRHWGPLARVSEGPVPSRLPALARDAQGRVHVIWTRYDDGVGKIYYRVWDGRWAAPQARISPPSGYAGYPALATDRSGNPQVVWYGIRSGPTPASTRHGSIYEIFYTGLDGHGWSQPLLISTGAPDSVNPALAADRAGRLYAVWYQLAEHAYQVRYAERNAAWSVPETVLPTKVDAFNPDVAVGPDGTAVVAWEHHDGLRSAIYFARRVGARWIGPAVLSAGDPPAHHPAVTTAPSGLVYVVWDDDGGRISLRRFGTGWDPVITLAAGDGNAFPSVLASAAGPGVVWTHTGPGHAQVRYLGLPW